MARRIIIKDRIAIIQMEIFVGYTGTGVPIKYHFLCWNDDKEVKIKAKEAEDKGYELLSLKIPYPKFDGVSEDE